MNENYQKIFEPVERKLDVDMYNVPSIIFDNLDKKNKNFFAVLKNIISSSGATILSSAEHWFRPQGYSIVFLLSESHASFHFTPEDNFISFSISTCGRIEPIKCLASLIEFFNPKKAMIKYTSSEPIKLKSLIPKSIAELNRKYPDIKNLKNYKKAVSLVKSFNKMIGFDIRIKLVN